MKKLDFTVPFSGFNDLTFENVLASLVLYLEGADKEVAYTCPSAEQSVPCTGCGNCRGSLAHRQEDAYFLFDTMSGRSSQRDTFDRERQGARSVDDEAEDTVDFLLKFVGYGYRVETEAVVPAVKRSIDGGIPAIVRMRDGANGRYRLIIGYDREGLVMASPSGAQRAPERDPLPEEISQVIVVTGRQTPEYTLKDGLRRIERVMEENRRLGVWKEAIGAFRYFDGGLCDADFAILRSRFQRICDMAWAHFNCHNFAETFRHRVTAELKDPRLDAVCRRIDAAYDLSHTRNWQLIALNDCRDWSSRRYNELEWGMCNCVIQCLEELCRSDEEVLNAIREARAALER